MASLKSYDKLLNDEVEKERMVISLRDMLITPNVLKNGFSSVDMERLDRTLKQVGPVLQYCGATGFRRLHGRLSAAGERASCAATEPSCQIAADLT